LLDPIVSLEMDDNEYKNFLYQCLTSNVEADNDTNTEDNDPSYVYNDDIYCYGWKFNLDEALYGQDGDQAVENQIGQPSFDGDVNHTTQTIPSTAGAISLHSTEQNYLVISQDKPQDSQSKGFIPLSRLQDQYSSGLSADIVPQHRAHSSSTAPALEICSPSKKRKLDIFNEPEFARVLNQQLRQHIQLLTQSYLLTKNTTNMRNYADEAKDHLDYYMKIFKNKRKPSNLLPALDLVHNFPSTKEPVQSIRLSWRHLPIPDNVKRTISEHPNIFMYQTLLPQVAFSLMPKKVVSQSDSKPKKQKINFTINEDKLLAFALNEFRGESQHASIASLLMTAKTKQQINNHIKNIKRSPGNEDNPIKTYFSHGILPQIDLDSDSELRVPDLDVQREKKELSLDQRIVEIHFDFVNGPSLPSGVLRQEHANDGVDSVDVVNPLGDKGLPQDQELDEKPIADTPVSPVPACSSPVIPAPVNSQGTGELVAQEEESVIMRQVPDNDDLMNMELDDLMAASTTISRMNACQNGNSSNNQSSENNKNARYLRLRKSMLNLIEQEFSLSRDMGDLIVHHYLKVAQDELSERNYVHLLQLLTNLMKKEIRLGAVAAAAASSTNDTNIAGGETGSINVKQRRINSIVKIYCEISDFLRKICAPSELREMLVLFLTFDQATRCGCALNYLHWMRFFVFMQYVEIHHDGDGVEKKIIRLIDALQKDDQHKFKLAAANLVNKHPFLKREFEALSLDGRPHASLFMSEEDFDDITEPMISTIDHLVNNQSITQSPGDSTAKHTTALALVSASKVTSKQDIHSPLTIDDPLAFEHFQSKASKEEIHYATQLCPCECHPSRSCTSLAASTTETGQARQQPIGQHCGKCNLKFIKGKMYLVGKIKPVLAKWSYTSTEIRASSWKHQLQQEPELGHRICDEAASSSVGAQSTERSSNREPDSSRASSSALMPAPPPRVAKANQQQQHQRQQQQQQQLSVGGPVVRRQQQRTTTTVSGPGQVEWTFEEDKEILEFCQAKAELNDDTVSFDSSIFEELVAQKRRLSGSSVVGCGKKSAKQIAERFNQLMEMYRMDESSSAA